MVQERTKSRKLGGHKEAQLK